MSKPNEPPLALDSWTITVDLNDGSNFKIESGDLEENEDLHTQNSERFVNYEKKSD